jgi:peroxiredoxin family protein
MSDTENSVGSASKPKKSKKKKSKKDGGRSGKGRDREKSRSPTRMRAGTGKKTMAGTGDLTMEEMADRVKKFGKLTVDEKSGAGSLDVVQKRLMSEDVEILLEMFRRFTEVQHVKFQRCFMTDDIFSRIVLEGLVGLRHLKSLILPFNMLTDKSATLVMEKFSKLSRQLQHLDFRSNAISEEVSEAMYLAFPAIQTLNEIPIYRSKRETDVTEIDLSKKQLKVSDIKILVCCLADVKPCHIEKVNLAGNGISAKALKVLAEGLKNVAMQSLDISNNPLTDGDLDFTGMEAMFLTAHRHKHLCTIDTAPCEFPEECRERLQTSLAVNRMLYEAPQKDGMFKDKFFSYIFKQVEKNTQALPEHAAEFDRDAIPEFVIDKQFYNINRLPTIDVELDKTGKGAANTGFDIKYVRDKREGQKKFNAMK